MIPMPVIALPLLGAPHDDPTPDIDLLSLLPAPEPGTHVVRIEQPHVPFVNAADHAADAVKDWDSFIGQGPAKRQLRVYIDDCLTRVAVLPHLLLTGTTGSGKTTLARLIADELHANITMLVPPFAAETLYEAALQMQDWDVLFIDEIHKLADNGPAAAENLLHLMEEGVLYLDDGVHELADFTLIGATTDAAKLPEAIIDRFVIKPYFQKYTLRELVKITQTNFCEKFNATLTPETIVAIAKACRGTPRVSRDLVVAARALQNSSRRYCTPQELLDFVEFEPDGMTRHHKAYILAMYQFGRREHGEGWEYVMGEKSLMTQLRENAPGLGRLERFLIECGLVDKTPRGRRLTELGIQRAIMYMARGEKLSVD